jgi:hypothetical protein
MQIHSNSLGYFKWHGTVNICSLSPEFAITVLVNVENMDLGLKDGQNLFVEIGSLL